MPRLARVSSEVFLTSDNTEHGRNKSGYDLATAHSERLLSLVD